MRVWLCDRIKCAVALVAVAVIFSVAPAAHAQTITLAWDSNPEPEVAGYIVYAGTQSGSYDREYDAGAVTTYTVPDITAGQRYCFAIAAYTASQLEGARSAEVCGYSNAPPVLINPGAQRHPVAQNLALQLQASDPSGEPLTFTASGLPPGLTLTGSTGYIQGSPTTAGTYQVTATASDGTLTDSASFAWTIDAANSAPVLVNPGNGRNQVGQSVTLQLQASDAQGQPLTFIASGLPPGLTLASSTGRITGTVTTAGTYQVTATVSDGALSDSETFTWIVEAPDTIAPIVRIAQPASNGTYSTLSSSVAVSGTVTDNVAVVQVSWQNDRGGQGTASGTASWATGQVALQWGWNVITVTATDGAGNTGTSVIRVNRVLPLP